MFSVGLHGPVLNSGLAPLPGISALSWSAPDLRHSGLDKSPEGSTSHVLLQINIAKHSKGIWICFLLFFFLPFDRNNLFYLRLYAPLGVLSDRLRSLFKKKKMESWIFYVETPGSTLCVWKSKLKSKGVSSTRRQLCGGCCTISPQFHPGRVPWPRTLVPVTTTWQLQFMQKLAHDGNCSWAVLDNLCAICFTW